MGRYLLRFDIKEAIGHQTYVVEDADNPQHALDLHNQGKSEFVDEEFSIMNLNLNPEIIPCDF